MSRLHSRKKGRASSKRPFLTKNPDWVTLPKPEIENIIVKLAREGQSSSVIGMRLRDQYGVPNVRLATGKSIVQILEANNIKPTLPEDLSNLIRRSTNLQVHLKSHRKDLANARGLTLIESKIRRLIKYYRRVGVLPEDWKYTPAHAKTETKTV